MTMKTWLARALRRFLGTAVMVLAADAALYRALFPPPAFPAADADRVTVRMPDGGSHQITDPATVAGITAAVRKARSERIRIPRQIHGWDTPGVRFYRGQAERGWILCGPRYIGVPAGVHVAVFSTGPDEAAELHRLLRPHGSTVNPCWPEDPDAG